MRPRDDGRTFCNANKPVRWWLPAIGFAVLLAGWEIAALATQPLLVPSPWRTLRTAYDLLADGILLQSTVVSSAAFSAAGCWAP